jgi:hypothetical protein
MYLAIFLSIYLYICDLPLEYPKISTRVNIKYDRLWLFGLSNWSIGGRVNTMFNFI